MFPDLDLFPHFVSLPNRNSGVELENQGTYSLGIKRKVCIAQGPAEVMLGLEL